VIVISKKASAIIAPLCDVGIPPSSLDRHGWTAEADSEVKSQGENRSASHAIDGDPETFWHSDFKRKPHASLPHHLDVFFGNTEYSVFGIVVWPRFDHAHGRIGKFEVYISEDGSSFSSSPVARGEWADEQAEHVRTSSPPSPFLLLLPTL
jgi:galactose oxidase